ncbi:nuclear transport factor 2 family protein [Frankia sp. AiPs1]|uniref:limonene-1,2-epoxide hydrolase family protein n=1 Tax=Frankia sp. AiPs1 TaxID=573493 RepID=UPI0020439C30|nr:limonene-1,2-epoxide hydrolase family protein [Frankia sp. AiPs1]MCM3924508.1 nuclear transport factor 2 family protein [Frankia sp. AiPs1]
MSDPARIVREFCDLMAKRDPALLRPFLAEDAVYQNTGTPASTGAAAVLANLAGQFAVFPDSYEYKMINLAVDGDVVLTERLDLIRTPDGVRGVPVMGAFVVREGVITRWTDYWDTGLPAKMMSGQNIDGLVPASY